MIFLLIGPENILTKPARYWVLHRKIFIVASLSHIIPTVINMKIKTLIIIGLLLLTSISIAEARSISSSNKKQVNDGGNDGRIFGYVETQGHNMPIAFPNLKVACGTNLRNYEIKVTDENGYYDFSDLTYESTGTKYYIWIPIGQRVWFRGIEKVELNDENSEEYVYLFVLPNFWRSRNNVINNFLDQLVKNLQGVAY